MSRSEAAATATRALSPAPAFGLEMTSHRRPFQCRISVLADPPRVRDIPTAHASEGDKPATAFRKLSPDAGSGVGTVRQCRPFQRSTRVLADPTSGLATPTAHTSDGEAADTPKSSSDSCAPARPISTCHPSRQALTAPALPVHDVSTKATRTRAPNAHRRLHPVLTEAPPGLQVMYPVISCVWPRWPFVIRR